MTVSKWGFIALFTLCSAVFAEIYAQCQKFQNNALSTTELSSKIYEQAFIHSMNGQWQQAEDASQCLLKMQNQHKWNIEASDLF